MILAKNVFGDKRLLMMMSMTIMSYMMSIMCYMYVWLNIVMHIVIHS